MSEQTIRGLARKSGAPDTSDYGVSKWAVEEITTLRQQLAESQARVAEFNQLLSGSSEAYILRKQAEAVIDAHNAMSDSFVLEATGVIQERAIVRCQDFLNNYAQSLRQQADEAERAGGE